MCNTCRSNPCHSSCPNYKPKKPLLFCSECKEGIMFGEEYITDDYGNIRHFECFDTRRDLAEWLGYKIQIYED